MEIVVGIRYGLIADNIIRLKGKDKSQAEIKSDDKALNKI